ncbi:MAG: SDR family NAD(P)-dependent oxidoreductase [Rudaea sp.]|uniref:SDR family NAD(P)-dependent oxidoreductase n=1 Tax=unclassified Rudaea TaxID=2627037 RepID=UPI0010F5A55B|nr:MULTISPECIES: SDR family NAD(P)-dependent oxidoreductase [unclassified Rudaea]MBN8884563.1 SDR family NAD(P)-dependent oxidoreductase [Rudaea sp.]
MTIELRDTARLPAAWTAKPDSLHGRVVLVVGAAGALGSASARAAAQAGAKVILLGRKVRPLEKLYDEIEVAQPGCAAIYPLDLAGASPKDYDDLAATIEREFGRLDGVVFAAAQFDGLQPMFDAKAEAWLKTLHVNLNAPFLILQACADLLLRASADDGEASVIFTIDDPTRVGKAFWGGYGTAKHALLGLVSTLHQEWESTRVRVHALLPAPMRSALRRMAYFGENTLELPTADGAAQAVVYLLADEGAAARGKILDLR